MTPTQLSALDCSLPIIGCINPKAGLPLPLRPGPRPAAGRAGRHPLHLPHPSRQARCSPPAPPSPAALPCRPRPPRPSTHPAPLSPQSVATAGSGGTALPSCGAWRTSCPTSWPAPTRACPSTRPPAPCPAPRSRWRRRWGAGGARQPRAARLCLCSSGREGLSRLSPGQGGSREGADCWLLRIGPGSQEIENQG